MDPSGLDRSDKSSLKKTVLGFSVAVMAIIVSVVSMRMYTRLRIVRGAGLDDWLMVAAACCTILLCSSSLVGVRYGLGTHIYLLPPSLEVLAQLTMRLTLSLYVC